MKLDKNIALRARAEFSGMLAIHPDWADRCASGNVPPTAGIDDDDTPDNRTPYKRRGNVAVVSILGPLSQRGGWWWDGHEAVRTRIEKALQDPTVGIVALLIDSPGGVVAGCWDAVRAVRRAAQASGKEIISFAGEHAYSAAYAWATAGKRLYVPSSGGTGSIGVLQILWDDSKFYDDIGFKATVIRSGDRKARGMSFEGLDETTVSSAQARVNMLAGQFYELVKEQRGGTAAKYSSLEGDVFDGPIAVERGIADGVLSCDEFFALADKAGKKWKMKGIAALLGLPETANEADIERALKALIEGNVALKATHAQVVEANADTAIEFAMRTGRITAAQKDGERRMLIESPIHGARSLLARPEGSALPKSHHEERPGADHGKPPPNASAHEFSSWGNMSDDAIARAYGNLIAVDADGPMRLAAADSKLYSRAREAWQKSIR